MVRIKSGVVTRARHKKILKSTRGYRGRQHKVFRLAKQANMKAGLHAYRGRKLKKRTFRALWIQRINAACRVADITYSRFIEGLTKAKIIVNRKNLADLAIREPSVFEKLINKAKENLNVK
jgi:large subunit ribosomal protein L20